jgi:hypothetical protein
MLKESIKSTIFTDGFRLIELLCQSYPPHCVVLRLELSELLWKKSHREQPILRLAMCERSSLGLPHTQNRMSGRPRVAEILLMRSPKTLRVSGDLKQGRSLWGWTVDNFQLSETVLKGRTGRGGSRRVGQLRKLRVSRPQASLCVGACVCARAHHSCGSGLSSSRAPAPDL